MTLSSPSVCLSLSLFADSISAHIYLMIQEDVASQATMYCVECRQNLCDRCCKEHKRQRLSKQHQVLQRGIPVKGDVAKLFGPNFCEFHPGKPADLYCSDCKGVLCMMCFAESHHSHQCTDITKMGENFRKQLVKDIDEVAGCLGEVHGMKRIVGKEKKRFAREVEDVRLKVAKRSEELKETLERHTKSLLDELASLQTIALEEFGKNMEDMERHLKTLETFKNYCEEMRSKGSPSDVCRSMVDLRKRTGELKDMHSVQVKKPICRLNVSFQATQNQDYVNSYPNMVGVITGTIRPSKQHLQFGVTTFAIQWIALFLSSSIILGGYLSKYFLSSLASLKIELLAHFSLFWRKFVPKRQENDGYGAICLYAHGSADRQQSIRKYIINK